MKFLRSSFGKVLAVLAGICLIFGVGFSVMACSPTQTSVKSFVNRIIREIQEYKSGGKTPACNSANNQSSCQNFFRNQGGVNNSISTYDTQWNGFFTGDVSAHADFKNFDNNIGVYASAEFVKNDSPEANIVAFDFLLANNNSNLRVIKINISRPGQPLNPAPNPNDGQVWA